MQAVFLSWVNTSTCIGAYSSCLYHTFWPDVCECITISGIKGGVLICHRGMMGVPLAMKIRVLTTVPVSHVPITGRTTEPPTSNNLPQGASRPHHLGPTCTFQGHFILWIPGSRFLGAGSRRLFSLPTRGLTRLSVPVICTLSGEAHVVHSIFRALGLPSRGLSFRSRRVS